ncbi:hypothetical protein VSR01_19020 [Actinacidiphila sp. DG2A-62]|nr:hypothetical protein [Actinacidiphila sp. DG2A-62]MEC3995506.1 hypothetical protein [Actinacidiphila sp. DG2A-62]
MRPLLRALGRYAGPLYVALLATTAPVLAALLHQLSQLHER